MSAIYSLQNSVQDVIRPVDLPVQSRSVPGSDQGKTGGVRGKRSPQQPGAVGQKVNPQDLKKHADQLNQVMQIFNYNIRFSVDRESKRVIVKVVNPATEEVVRQIPPEEMLQIMKRIDRMLGLILDEKV